MDVGETFDQDLERLPGGGSRPKLLGSAMVMRPRIFHRHHVDFDVDGRLDVDLDSVLGPCWGRGGSFVGSSWSQDHLRTGSTSKK